jgi:hypothetical protein
MKYLLISFILILFLVTGCRTEEENPVSARIVGLYEPGNIVSPSVGDILEKGSLLEIKWTGFNIKFIRLELLKKSQYYRQVITNSLENQGSFSWIIPYDTQGSVSYQVKLINAEDETDFIYSGVFQIR